MLIRFCVIICLSLSATAAFGQILLPPIADGSGSLRRLPPKSQKAVMEQYRKPTKDELETLKPNAADAARYAAFLRQPETGLTRLAADLKCADNTKIVVVTPDCLKYTMPGAGSSFSFRTANYRIQRLADLTYSGGGFQATGVFVQGILTRIGDVPLEKVDLQTRGLKYLVEFTPAADFEEAGKFSKMMVEGVNADSFLYRRGLNAYENTTYVLRSIAYDGEYNRAFAGITYNEFDFDRRRDVVVAFRIVRKDADGSVTILWRKLAEKDAPKLKRRKAEASQNFF